ncbi:hydroxyacylglutathione hydrolase [Leptospira ellisii]|uniref:Hydroxyacylglutathione hydrolase n=2 Tax=Leptospira ellisii TaxID=2023197 RepID=A0AAE4TWZ5_9LEPT|nr:hydroxyacylglutathione hydrolase [Leptospira ellisii]MDV6234994.1 hydroxyacylglutathione hydrolase [Leptospira ellisii]PKA04676.1 hydroxyacylglutathione hydrolase [Leptospira ellisii]
MEVFRFYTRSPLRNFTYILRNPEIGKTLSIDPYDSVPIRKFLEEKGWNLDFILNTHEHADHTSGNDGLVKEYSPIVYAHPGAIGKIPHATHPVKKGDRILASQNGHLEILDTPGHTFCHVCLLLVEEGKRKAVFTGDTLFNAGVGNCYRGGEAAVLAKTVLEQFYPMEDEVLLYPGHDYWGTNLRFTLSLDPNNRAAIEAVKEYETFAPDEEFPTNDLALEKKINVFFRCKDPSYDLQEKVFQKTGTRWNPNSPEGFFVSLRALRDKW